mmetsp:Transcript_14209/g.34762  ORF Transcript_14209/g.34762 Transcript_14209/m.34762 type:complete len:604 (-) Transcript_14209:155-1966(-)
MWGMPSPGLSLLLLLGAACSASGFQLVSHVPRGGIVSRGVALANQHPALWFGDADPGRRSAARAPRGHRGPAFGVLRALPDDGGDGVPSPQRSEDPGTSRDGVFVEGIDFAGIVDPVAIIDGTKGDERKKKSPSTYVLYNDRWIQLLIVSLLALLSDWACFATAGGPATWVRAFHESPAELIDLFLFTNVASCFFFTDVTRKFGLRKVVTGAAGMMALGCLFRSGMPVNYMLPSYSSEIIGTILIGAAQPFFQCTPPLLSATWFGQDERALSTAVCLNANQLGIATAFLVGSFFLGGKGSSALDQYLSVITVCSLATFLATVVLFKDRPPSPPTSSAKKHAAEEDARRLNPDQGFKLTFPKTAVQLLRTKGFLAPLAAFVCSITVTNVVSAFTTETMQRAGFYKVTIIDEIGAAFQVAIMAGGIILGKYVDDTKRYKQVTLACFGGTFVTLLVLGVAEGYKVNLPAPVVISSLLLLGLSAGPVQPINAELAVEVSYPADECAVEATQQLCGNLFSALLVPLCVKAMSFDWTFTVPQIFSRGLDIRGDTILLLGLVGIVTAFFATFDAELKREEADSAGDPVHVSHVKDQKVKKLAAENVTMKD